MGSISPRSMFLKIWLSERIIERIIAKMQTVGGGEKACAFSNRALLPILDKALFHRLPARIGYD